MGMLSMVYGDHPGFSGARPTTAAPLQVKAVGVADGRLFVCVANWDSAEVHNDQGACLFRVTVAPTLMFRGYFWVVGGSLLVATIGGVVNEALLAWNITSGQLVSQIRQPGARVTVDQHTGMAVVYCGGGCVEYWDLFTGTHRSTRHFSGGPWWPESLDFASDPGWTVLAGSDHLLLWAGDMVVELDGLENGDALEWPVRIRPRQREVVYGLGETLYAFRLADRSIRPLGSLPLPAPRTEFQALSDDGRWLLIVHDHGWSVLDLETGQQAAAAFGRAWGFAPHRTAVVCEGATPLSIVLVAFHSP